VLLITVNYKGADQTIRLLESLRYLGQSSEMDVIIVDNASGDDSVRHLRAAAAGLENVRLLESTTNRGYFGGAKLGMARYLEEAHALPEWLIVCNNDIFIDDSRFLKNLLNRNVSAHGVIAPRVRSCQTRLDLNPFMRKRPSRWTLAMDRFWSSTYRTAVLRNLISRKLRSLRSRRSRRDRALGSANEAGPQPIYAPHGACIIFSRVYFESGGYIDDGFFLYGEEISVAEICRRLGLSVSYDPSLSLWHQEHAAAGITLSRFAYNCQKAADQYVRRTYLADIA
jgi:GT2 family glycosyltransferase